MLSVNTFSSVMMFGLVSTAIMQLFTSNPLLHAFMNTTLVFLENTQAVWKPVVEFSLVVLKPFGPLATLVLDNAVKAMVVLGYMTVVTVRKAVTYANSTLNLVKESGMSLSTALTNAALNIKDVVVSLGTLTNAVLSLTSRMIRTASYIVNSFEHVSDFLYRSVFETQTITWQDMVDVALPSLVVFFIASLLVWRLSKMVGSIKTPSSTFVDNSDLCTPVRRSSRLACKQNPYYGSSRSARKRALISSSDAVFSR